MFPYPFTALVTLFGLGVYFVLGFNVGRARFKYKVLPPVTDGPPEFQRRYRAHQNTGEFLPFFITVVWLAALTVGDSTAAMIGFAWPVGRILYAIGYYHDSNRRMPGFALSVISLVALWITVLVAVVYGLVGSG